MARFFPASSRSSDSHASGRREQTPVGGAVKGRLTSARRRGERSCVGGRVWVHAAWLFGTDCSAPSPRSAWVHGCARSRKRGHKPLETVLVRIPYGPFGGCGRRVCLDLRSLGDGEVRVRANGGAWSEADPGLEAAATARGARLSRGWSRHAATLESGRGSW